MATFHLNLSSPFLTSKTNPDHLPLSKLTLKPFYSTPITSKNTHSPYYHLFTTSKLHKISTPISASAVAGKGIRSVVELEKELLHHGLRPDLMPNHVAIVMEKEPIDLVHGRRSVIDVARMCCDLGIKVLSVYTSSSENDQQKEGADFTINLSKSDLQELSRNDIKVTVIGNRNGLPDTLLQTITELEQSTNNNKSFHIIETVNYSGHFDIIQSCKALAEKVSDGVIQLEEIDENAFRQELETKFVEFPDPDLVIRTGGRSNVGNFMLWQSAYAEICFVDKDGLRFSKEDLLEVLLVYQKRNRRFGGSDKK